MIQGEERVRQNVIAEQQVAYVHVQDVQELLAMRHRGG